MNANNTKPMAMHSSNEDSAPTIIDSDVEIHGKIILKGDKNIIIKGLLNGEIESSGSVTVDVSGKVHGSIQTRNLIIEGRIETDMDVSVSGVLTVRRGGVLIASKISYGDLCHESGARMTGQLEPYESSEKELEVQAPFKVDARKFSGVQAHQGKPSSAASVNAPLSPVTSFPGSSFRQGHVSSAPKPVEGVTTLPFRSDLGAPDSLYTPSSDHETEVKDSSLSDIERG